MIDHTTFLYKAGRVVLLNVRLSAKVALTLGVSQNLFKLPEGFTPAGYCRFPSASGGMFLGEIVVESDGVVRFNASSTNKLISDGTMCVFIAS